MDNPVLLYEQKMNTILTQLRAKVDVVIIDGPALLSGAEANILAAMVDGVAVIVDAQHNKLPLLNRATEVLNSLTHTPAGVILNCLPRQKQNSYYASTYSSGTTAQENIWIPVHTVNGNNANVTQKPEPELSPGMSPMTTIPARRSTVFKGPGGSPEAISLPSRQLDTPFH